MIHALNLDKNNRVLSTTWDEYAPAEYPRVSEEELPLKDNGERDDIHDYLYIDGKFIYDPIPEPEEEPTELDKLEAQVTYTAMMTDTLLEV